MHHDPKLKQNFFLSHKAALIALILLGALLIINHWNHILSALPYLVLLSCPLMHLFMHGRHDGHGNHDDHCHQNSQKDKKE